MKTLLLFPPQAQPFMPHLALPLLAGVLKREGVEVVLQDLNLEVYEHFLSPPVLEKLGLPAEMAAQAPAMVGALRSGQEFFDPPAYYQSIAFVQSCLQWVSGRYAGLQWSLKHFTLRNYSPSSWNSIYWATHDRKANPLIDYFFSRKQEWRDENPRLVGISVAWEDQLIPAFTLARVLKKLLPQAHICMGGSMISHLAEYFRTIPKVFDFVDSLLPMEGETGIVALAKALESGQLRDVPGLVFRHEQQIVSNPPDLLKKLHSLPHPDFDGLPLEKYYSPRTYLPVLASRGCYYAKCAFCTHHMSGSNYRSRRVEDVMAELSFLHDKYACSDFYFVDDSLPPALGLKLANQITAQHKPYRWVTELRFEKMMTVEYFHALYQGGARVLLFGLETGSQRVGDLMAKGTRKEQAAALLSMASAAGIITWVFFFLGFPGETEAEGQETLDFLLEHRRNIDMIAGGSFVLTRNSPVYNQPEKYSVRVEEQRHDLQLAYGYTLEEGERWETQRLLAEFSQRPEAQEFMRPFVAEPHMLYFTKDSFKESLMVGSP